MKNINKIEKYGMGNVRKSKITKWKVMIITR